MSNRVKKRLLLIQPGRIGDIIICAPIAKYFSSEYDVTWPIHKNYIKMMKPAFGHYVNFKSVPGSLSRTPWWIYRNFGLKKYDKVIDMSFGFGTSRLKTRTWIKTGKPFDLYKYEIANVPFENKWNLDIARNHIREKSLFEKKVGNLSRYTVYHFNSAGRRIVTKKVEPAIEIRKDTDNIFDWLLVLEKAEKVVLIDSCFANLVEQMGFKCKKVMIRKNNYPPVLKGWRVVKGKRK